ncbi:hypothetical protein [Serratia bockelmannii]|uniref:hypothetical protein n=1 Tax=Serratia bockelmannii TaxID=2703793 RepID=UPI00313D76B0
MTEVLTYEALKAERDALAVENAALKDACGGDGSYRDCPACAHSQYIESPETPATSVALAAIEARILPPNIAEIIDSGDLEAICFHSSFADRERIRMALYEFRQMREAK